MWPLFALGFLFAAASSSSSSSSSSSGSDPSPLADDTIGLTCDQAVDLLPSDLQPIVADAIMTGTVKAAVLNLAAHLQDVAASTSDVQLNAALRVAAHCLEARADTLPGASIFAPTSSSVGPASYSAPGARSVTYRAPAGGY